MDGKKIYLKDVGCEVIDCFGMAAKRFCDGHCEYSSRSRSVNSVPKSMDLGSIWNYIACKFSKSFKFRNNCRPNFRIVVYT